MSKVRAIKCTKCAAPLNFLGGGRVATITCSYCKSILSVEKNFPIIGNFKNIKQAHQVPFDIGMKGELEGIEYTIIGRVTYEELGTPDSWDDFLLFSPLYGYAWLTYEYGHLIYSKRNRWLPEMSWNTLEEIETKRIDDRIYQVDDTYTARISYIEGELTWRAKKHDKIRFIDLYSPPYGISVERSSEGIEYYSSHYLSTEEVYQAFSVPKNRQVLPTRPHALQEFGETFFKPLAKISLWTILVTFFLFLFVMYTGSGSKPRSSDTNSTKMPFELERIPPYDLIYHADNTAPTMHTFSIDNKAYLTTLTMEANSSKSLNNFQLQILQGEEKLFSMSKNGSYLNSKIRTFNKEKLETWEYRAKGVKAYLKLPVGDYTLLVTPVSFDLNSSVKISIRQGVARTNYFLWFIMLLLFSLALYQYQKMKHYQALDDEESFFGFGTSIFRFIFFFLIGLFIYKPYDSPLGLIAIVPFLFVFAIFYNMIATLFKSIISSTEDD